MFSIKILHINSLLVFAFITNCYALPASEKLVQREAKVVVEQNDVRSLIGLLSQHIGKNIEVREREGSLKDENDPLAIMLTTVRKLRQEIEQKIGIDLDESERSGRRSERESTRIEGMPEGMEDVEPTASSSRTNFAASLSILFSNPNSLKSLNENLLEDCTFQDYIKLAEEEDPELLNENVEIIRKRTLLMMRNAFKEELKKLAYVFLARWTDNLQVQMANGNVVAMILFAAQELIMKQLIDLIVDTMAKHSTKMIERISEFARNVQSSQLNYNNQPNVAATGMSRFSNSEQSNDRGQWMLQYMID